MSQAELKASATSASPIAPAEGGPKGNVREAIARAAKATGVDFAYLLAQARLESSLDPQARATASSAAGLYQFTRGTWGTMLARHGAALGLGEAGAGINQPGSRSRMALRYDPAAAAMMAAALAGDNTTALTATLGRAPRASELYLAHFLGTAGATRLLGALGADPGQPAAALLPKAAAANPGVFYDSTGAARSVGSVMALIQSRMDTAMAGGPDGSDPFVDDVTMTTGPGDDAVYQASAGPIAQQFAQAQASASGAASTDPIAGGGTDSMSDTLRAMFGMAGENGGAGAAPAFVRSAYGQMQALGL